MDMGKIDQLKAQIRELDTEIAGLNDEICDILDAMEATGAVQEEAPALERERKLRAATLRRFALSQQRDQAQFDLNCREAWGEDWDKPE